MRAIKKLCALIYLAASALVVGGCALLAFGRGGMQAAFIASLEQLPVRMCLIAALALVALGALVAFVRILAARKPLASVHPAGAPEIEVRLAAVTSVARAAAEEAADVMVEDVAARVAGRADDELRITLDLIAFTQTGLASLGAHVRTHVERSIDEMLGVPGAKVRVRFLPSVTTTVPAKEVAREQS